MNLGVEVLLNKGPRVLPLHLLRPQESQACVSCGVQWRQGLWGWHPAVSSGRVPAAASEWQEHSININCISKRFMRNRHTLCRSVNNKSPNKYYCVSHSFTWIIIFKYLYAVYFTFIPNCPEELYRANEAPNIMHSFNAANNSELSPYLGA